MSKSVVTKYEDISAFSSTPADCKHHLVFGSGKRDLAEEYGLWIPLTNAEHNMSSKGLIYQIHENPAAEKLSKIAGQLAFKKEYYRKQCGVIDDRVADDPAREAFRKVFGESYL